MTDIEVRERIIAHSRKSKCPGKIRSECTNKGKRGIKDVSQVERIEQERKALERQDSQLEDREQKRFRQQRGNGDIFNTVERVSAIEK